MRNIWIIISTLAIANLLAFAGFAGWLKATDRLSGERLEQIRMMFASTVHEEAAQKAEAALQAAAEQAAQDLAKRNATPPLTAEQKMAAAAQESDVATLEDRRIQRDTTNLINTLVKERQQLEAERAEFRAQVAEFNEMRERIATEEGSEQFEKAVILYQSLKAEQARAMMGALIAQGQTEQVVSYLNALPPRNASKILAEFEGDDPALAADLLERLRTRGLELAALPDP